MTDRHRRTVMPDGVASLQMAELTAMEKHLAPSPADVSHKNQTPIETLTANLEFQRALSLSLDKVGKRHAEI
jgi:hypothetical protein